MHERFVERMEDKLKKLQAAAESGKLRDSTIAHQRLGRLKERYWRAGGAFEVKIAAIDKPAGKARLSITWSKNARWSDWNTRSEGCYLLRTNLTDMDPATLWKRYIQLTEAEWAFRITKDELEIRPIWHRHAERVKAHILVCFLAYVLWKALAQWMKGSGLGDAPRTPVEELANPSLRSRTWIKSGDVVLRARRSDESECLIRVRCVTTPDNAQRVLLNRLGLTLPQRLRYLEEVAQM